MSGIFGIKYFDDKPIDPILLDRMLTVLAHRGPDGSKAWHDCSVGFGHLMSHTTPESLHEELPFVNHSSRTVITADARIDNREELISALALTSSPSNTISDSGLILHAYEKWGTDCPKRLLGDFAFAIWDGRKQRLFCARDPIGIKSFYYYCSNKVFVFASELKAILCLEEIPRKLNKGKLADWLVPSFGDQIGTYYEDILRFLPAHWMTVEGGRMTIRSYWNLDPDREICLGSDEEYAEAFREHFLEAVRCRTRSAFPIGSTLSGGLDSSSVACSAGRILAEEGRDPIHTLSAIFPDTAEKDSRIDEREYMDAAVEMGIFEPHYVRVDQARPLADALCHKDEPCGGLSLYIKKTLFKAAQENKVRILLSGFGGDEIVSYGYGYMEQLAAGGQWADFARESNALLQRRPQLKPMTYLHLYGIPCLTDLVRKLKWLELTKEINQISNLFEVSRHRLFGYALKPFFRPAYQIWKSLHRINGSGAIAFGLNNAINPNFAKQIGLASRIQAYRKYNDISKIPVREQQIFGFTNGSFEVHANMIEHTAAAFSLELRYPFFDRRLIEFCLAVPFRQKLRNGWTRFIFRRAMQGILPRKIQWRVSKGHLSSNVRLCLFREREVLDTVILQNTEVIAPYLNISVLQASYRRFLGDPISSSEEDLFTIFLSASLSKWLSQTDFSL